MRSRLPSTLARCARSGRSGSDEKAGNGCGAGADTTTAHGRLMLAVLGASTTSRNPDPAVILAGRAIGHAGGDRGRYHCLTIRGPPGPPTRLRTLSSELPALPTTRYARWRWPTPFSGTVTLRPA
jgi:hypothetical protein